MIGLEKSIEKFPSVCRIIDKKLDLHQEGLHMAYAGKGTYKGANWKVTPLGFRRYLRCGRWVFPYFVGEKVNFTLEVEPTKDMHLNDFPLYVRYTEPEYIVQLQEPAKLPDSVITIEQHGATVSGKKTIEYWIGKPNEIKSEIIFGETGNYNDKVILDVLLGLFLAVIGFVLGLIAG